MPGFATVRHGLPCAARWLARSRPSSFWIAPWIGLAGAMATGPPSTSCQGTPGGASQARNASIVMGVGSCRAADMGSL